VSAQPAPLRDKWRSHAPVIHTICLVVILTIGISVAIGRSGNSHPSTSSHAGAQPSSSPPGILLPGSLPPTTPASSSPPPSSESPSTGPTGQHCNTQGSVITCAHHHRSPQLQQECSSNPTAPECVTSGSPCPASLAGVQAQNTHHARFVCAGEIWNRAHKAVTSGES
jgi:hypothetical protein